MYYRAYISDLYQKSYYNTTEIINMSKILISCGLQENFLLAEGFFGSYYSEFNSSQDVLDCINQRKDRLMYEDVNVDELIASIEELLNCKNISDLNSKFSQSKLYIPNTGIEESQSPFDEFNSLDEYERDEWVCFKD